MKKKVLIVSHAMELGGAERALLGLLDSFDYSQFDVDLFLLRHEGELFPYINENVNLLPEIEKYKLLDVSIASVLKRGNVSIAIGRLIGKYLAKNYIEKNSYKDKYSVAIEYSHKYTRKYLPKLNYDVEYDMAISFLTPHYIVAEKVNAKKKVAWIHTDYSVCEINKKSELLMWSEYDNIISISEDVATAFVSTFPELERKIVIVENSQPEKLIRNQIDAFSVNGEMATKNDCVRLLSVGRFCFAKNFDNVPFICKALVEKGVNVVWYLIGFGLDEELIKSKISEAKMEEHVVILGKKENPYPYIKECDLYVQPSRFEGKAVTVKEAQMLCKPVVITNYATASSQLVNGYDGVVVPMDNEKCAEGIYNLLNDQQKISMLIQNCSVNDYSNSKEILKLYELF